MESSVSDATAAMDTNEASPYDKDTSEEPEPEIETVGTVEISVKDAVGFSVKDDTVTVQVDGGLVVPMILFSEMISMHARKHGVPGFQQAPVIGTHVIDGVKWGLNWTERMAAFRVDITRGYVEEQYLRSNVRQNASRDLQLAQNRVKEAEMHVANARKARLFEKQQGGTGEDQMIEETARHKALDEAKAAVKEAQKAYDLVKDSRETRESWVVEPEFLVNMAGQGVAVQATRIDLEAQMKERSQ